MPSLGHGRRLETIVRSGGLGRGVANRLAAALGGPAAHVLLVNEPLARLGDLYVVRLGHFEGLCDIYST